MIINNYLYPFKVSIENILYSKYDTAFCACLIETFYYNNFENRKDDSNLFWNNFLKILDYFNIIDKKIDNESITRLNLTKILYLSMIEKHNDIWFPD